MNEHFMLTNSQLNRIKPYFPLPHGVKRVSDRKVISGILYVLHRIYFQIILIIISPHSTD